MTANNDFLVFSLALTVINVCYSLGAAFFGTSKQEGTATAEPKPVTHGENNLTKLSEKMLALQRDMVATAKRVKGISPHKRSALEIHLRREHEEEVCHLMQGMVDMQENTADAHAQEITRLNRLHEQEMTAVVHDMNAHVAGIQEEAHFKMQELESSLKSHFADVLSRVVSPRGGVFADPALIDTYHAGAPTAADFAQTPHQQMTFSISSTEAAIRGRTKEGEEEQAYLEEQEEDYAQNYSSSSENSPQQMSNEEIELHKIAYKKAAEAEAARMAAATEAMDEVNRIKEEEETMVAHAFNAVNETKATLQKALEDSRNGTNSRASTPEMRCTNFKIDVNAEFGKCLCGASKEEHDESALPFGWPVRIA